MPNVETRGGGHNLSKVKNKIHAQFQFFSHIFIQSDPLFQIVQQFNILISSSSSVLSITVSSQKNSLMLENNKRRRKRITISTRKCKFTRLNKKKIKRQNQRKRQILRTWDKDKHTN